MHTIKKRKYTTRGKSARCNPVFRGSGFFGRDTLAFLPVANSLDEGIAHIPKRRNHATVSIRCGSEAVSFRVYRFDEKRLLIRGKPQAASTIGRRVALLLEAVL